MKALERALRRVAAVAGIDQKELDAEIARQRAMTDEERRLHLIKLMDDAKALLVKHR